MEAGLSSSSQLGGKGDCRPSSSLLAFYLFIFNFVTKDYKHSGAPTPPSQRLPTPLPFCLPLPLPARVARRSSSALSSPRSQAPLLPLPSARGCLKKVCAHRGVFQHWESAEHPLLDLRAEPAMSGRGKFGTLKGVAELGWAGASVLALREIQGCPLPGPEAVFGHGPRSCVASGHCCPQDGEQPGLGACRRRWPPPRPPLLPSPPARAPWLLYAPSPEPAPQFCPELAPGPGPGGDPQNQPQNSTQNRSWDQIENQPQIQPLS